MIRRYLLTLAGLFGLGLACFLTLLPLLMVRGGLEPGLWMRGLCIWILMLALSLPLLLSLLIRKVWFFSSAKTPCSVDDLKRNLMSVNRVDCPVAIRDKGRVRLVAEYRYTDPGWCERMAALHLRRLCELRLRLQVETRTVLIRDRFRRVDFSLCPIRVNRGRLALPGLVFRFRSGTEKGISFLENTPPSQYRFRARELKGPVVSLILENGWNVRLTLF